MISIRKYIEEHRAESPAPAAPAPERSHHSVSPAVAELRSLLLTVGDCAGRAVPNLKIDIAQELTAIERHLHPPATHESVTETGERARRQIAQWAEQALGRHGDIQRDLREVVTALSVATAAVCNRDEKYVSELGSFTNRLGAIAGENNLARLRASLVECTKSLKSCVARMTEESEASVRQLSVQVQAYRTRLDEAERDSLTDALTGLSNRRAFEKHVENRIADGKPFCFLMMDLDHFKAVNDSFGHVAGDDLLKQFGSELSAQFTEGEMVSRLGGDEFIAVIGGDILFANRRAESIRRSVLREYTIDTGERAVRTILKASLGLAQWDGQETLTTLLARADRAVYRSKGSGIRPRNIESDRRIQPEKTAEIAEFDHLIR